MEREEGPFLPLGALWVPSLVKELLAFPNAAHDDRTDVCTYGAIEMSKMIRPRIRRLDI